MSTSEGRHVRKDYILERGRGWRALVGGSGAIVKCLIRQRLPVNVRGTLHVQTVQTVPNLAACASSAQVMLPGSSPRVSLPALPTEHMHGAQECFD